jgi:hypothetical protein
VDCRSRDRVLVAQSECNKHEEINLAERFVDAFGNIAKQGNTMIIPGNAADIAGLVATAMQVVKKT